MLIEVTIAGDRNVIKK